MRLRTSLFASVTALAIAGPVGVGEASAQELDLSGPLELVEETQDAVQGAAEDTLAFVPSQNPPASNPPSPNGGGSEPAPDPPPGGDPAGNPASAPPSDDSSSGDGATRDGPAPASAGPSTRRPPDPDPARRRDGSDASPRDARIRQKVGRRPQPQPDAPAAEPTTLERIVAVVPTEIKVALALLALLAAGSLLSARRTRGKLAQAEQRAATDPLTELPNRVSAEQVLERLIAQGRRQGKPVSVALFDLDHFKAVNDTFGHAAGDQALCEVAQAARTILRGGDHIARFGGEEFLLILPDTDREGSLTAAETLRKAISDLEIDGPETITASFGVATMPADALDPTGLLAAADRALYAAKDGGRDRVEPAGRPEPVLEPAA